MSTKKPAVKAPVKAAAKAPAKVAVKAPAKALPKDLKPKKIAKSR